MADEIAIADTERGGKPSASSASIWMRCQGQPNMVRSLPPRVEDDSTPESRRGTKIHDALLYRNPEILDEGERAAYDNAIRNEQLAVEQWKAQLGLESVVEEERELRLWLWDKQEAIVSGKIDTHFIECSSRNPCVLIEDFKTGSSIGAAPAAENPQLKVLAVLAKYEYGARHVRVFVNRCESWGEQVDVADYDEAALAQAEYMVRFHLWLASQPSAPRTPGAHCHWCAAIGSCPENAAMAMLPSVATGGALARVDSLSHEDLKKLWLVDSDLRRILDKVSARLATFSDEDLNAIGLRRGKAKEVDKFIDVNGAVTALYEAGLTKTDLWNTATLGKGKLVELIRREFALSEAAAEKWLAEKCAPYMEVKQGARPIVEMRKP